ncbi:MAG: DegQ family serine endoprotease [bacterium]
MKKIPAFSVVLFICLSSFSSARAADTFPSFSGIVEKYSNAVVNISTMQVVKEKVSPFPFLPGMPDLGQPEEKELRKQSLGSGFIIDPTGFILTCNHVIQGAKDITVILSDEVEYPAEIVGSDEKTDIALIRIKARKELPAVVLGDADMLKVGDWVVAVGNPFGLGHTVTAGIVSAKGRVIGSGPYDDYIQTDAAINPGNSGGPLFNLDGAVVGINSAIFSTSGGNIGIGFAIPVNIAKDILPSLKTLGHVERGWLGVTVQKVTQDLAKSFRLTEPNGALVADVVQGSPADLSGIKRGDIITAFDGKKIMTMNELPRMVAATPIGKEVNITVIRDGKAIDLTVKITKLSQEGGSPEALIERKTGIKTRNITPDIANQMGIMDGGAVLVSAVTSPLEKGGFLPGDIILEMNRKRVTSTVECAEALRSIPEGESVLFLIKRAQGFQYITVQVK